MFAIGAFIGCVIFGLALGIAVKMSEAKPLSEIIDEAFEGRE